MESMHNWVNRTAILRPIWTRSAPSVELVSVLVIRHRFAVPRMARS